MPPPPSPLAPIPANERKSAIKKKGARPAPTHFRNISWRLDTSADAPSQESEPHPAAGVGLSDSDDNNAVQSSARGSSPSRRKQPSVSRSEGNKARDRDNPQHSEPPAPSPSPAKRCNEDVEKMEAALAGERISSTPLDTSQFPDPPGESDFVNTALIDGVWQADGSQHASVGQVTPADPLGPTLTVALSSRLRAARHADQVGGRGPPIRPIRKGIPHDLIDGGEIGRAHV